VNKGLRIAVAIPGVFFLLNGLGWLFDPKSAAEGLGMPLLDGLGRSTQVGDLGAFFLALSAMILLGAWTLQRQWIYSACMVLGGAAVVRTIAWLAHGADFAGAFIGVEVVVTLGLLAAVSRFPKPPTAAS
jgi:hypothetical protein